MERSWLVGETAFELIQGNIVEQSVDVIVNAANSSLLGGGGVDGAIHRTGGPAILAECREIRNRRGRCPAGDAVITTAGRLDAKFVVHTVGPRWSGGGAGERELLSSCYRKSLQLAHERNMESIAFPSISTGAYRYPFDRATSVALEATTAYVEENPGALSLVRFVVFTATDFELFEGVLDA